MTLDTKFAEVLETIATNLGIAAERIFGIFVGAQYIVGVMDMLVMVFAILLTYIICKRACAIGGVKKLLVFDDISDLVFGGFLIALAVFGTLVVMWSILWIISSGILKIACPEYTAMKEIIGLVR